MIAEALHTEAEAEAPASTEAPPAPTVNGVPAKQPRPKLYVEVHVRPWEREYPPEAQRTIGLQRHELTAANRALRRANETIRELRREVRLHSRVLRLKHEQKLEGITQQIDRQLAAERELDAKAALGRGPD